MDKCVNADCCRFLGRGSAISLKESKRYILIFLIADPSRPKTMGFTGSEDYIRLQFEEYILALLASVKYSIYLEKHGTAATLLPEVGQFHNCSVAFVGDFPNEDITDGDPSSDFGADWVHHWKTTENFRIFNT